MPLYARRMGECSCEKKLDKDEALIAFWDRFPCPPPWNTGLLFKMNWTGCLGSSIGHTVLTRMAQKCHIPIPENYQALTVEPNPCGLRCQLLIVIICCVILLIMMIVLLVICYRRKSKKLDSPSHQIALGPYRYYDKSYAGTIHNNANPILRHSEALLVGDKPETRVFNGNLDAMYKHYVTDSLQKPLYDEPNCHELSLPLNNTYKPVIESDVTPSTASSVDKSPIYETIDGEDDEFLHELYDYTYPREITVRFSDSYSPGKSPPYDSIGRHTKRNNLKLDIPNRSNRPHKDSDNSASSQRRRKKPKYCRTDSSSYSDQTEMSSLSTSDGSSGRYSAPLTNGSFYSSHIVYR